MNIEATRSDSAGESPTNRLMGRPWWKEPYVWMVISGPLSVVVACLVTAYFILQGPDAVVSENYYREGIEISKQLQTAQPPMQPAQMGRNHSATGGRKDAPP